MISTFKTSVFQHDIFGYSLVQLLASSDKQCRKSVTNLFTSIWGRLKCSGVVDILYILSEKEKTQVMLIILFFFSTELASPSSGQRPAILSRLWMFPCLEY